MKNSQTTIIDRRKKIIDHLKEHIHSSTDELALLLNASPITIRRDLQALEAENLIKRYHGGASLSDTYSSTAQAPSFLEENPPVDLEDYHSKHTIARYAASLVENGDTIFINSSSTALLLLEYLEDKRVVVVTNNGKVLQTPLGPNIELVLTGGEVYGRKQSMVGNFATLIFSKITASKCFIGVSGIHPEHGITTSVLKETLINQEMIHHCNGPVFVLADSSKVGKIHNFSSGDLQDVTHIITDSNISHSQIGLFKQKGIEVTALPCP
ncbi:MAG: DeoR/GlpR family DNA-binding transcription regulator [Cellulosilyticaceae bacterium]